MRFAFIALAAALSACAVSAPGGVTKMNHEVDLKGYGAYSWGLAGVSREHYDDVSIECTARTVFEPVAPPSADRLLTPTVDASTYDLYRLAASEEMAEARQERRARQEIMDACLTEFGFVRFGLTDEQLAVLDTLPRGNPQRRDYMYSLGSSADVLARQKL